MLADFFQLTAIPDNQLLGTYNNSLVALSYLVAVFASYIALDFTGRLRDPSNTSTSRLLWLIGGAIAMGSGIWSMHFIGMLSFNIPGMMQHYELIWTGASLLVAVIASGFALTLLQIREINVLHLAIGGFFLGLAIAAMHYTGMEAMKFYMNIHYLPWIFLLSLIIAISASEAALWLALKSNQVESKVRIRLKIVSAIIMGLAICGMHYTGMIAAVITPLENPATMHPLSSLDPTLLSLSIACVTFIILGTAFFASNYKEALIQQQFEKARQLGMAEVSSSVLHNVGNVLNSVNVSVNLISDKVNQSQLKGIDDLNKLIDQNKHDLANFIGSDSRGSHIPDFLKIMSRVRLEEEKYLLSETVTLTKNIQLIKDIISSQQNMSKLEGMEQIVSVEHVIEEALLLSEFSFSRYQIMLKKHYSKINSILIDKVLLLQILINVIQNAKDSLIESSNSNKLLTIDLGLIKDTVCIKIGDNGVGITPAHMKKIFIYGFTTKSKGHGFGLHMSILTIRRMNGDIKVESPGKGKGALFTLQFPYKIPKK